MLHSSNNSGAFSSQKNAPRQSDRVETGDFALRLMKQEKTRNAHLGYLQ